MVEEKFFRRIRSFVRRDGRMSDGQRRVLTDLWPTVGLNLADGKVNLEKVFGRKAPCMLEIGFGSGHSLLEIARANPEVDFIGIETYQPGIGALLLGMEALSLKNIRVYYADAVEVLQQCIEPSSLQGLQIFFPDPWQKRKHHKRRLIQPDFVNMATERLQPAGVVHLATDWENYAEHMMAVLSAAPHLTNLAGERQFAQRSAQRPVITKFELRGQDSGRPIWELQFARC